MAGTPYLAFTGVVKSWIVYDLELEGVTPDDASVSYGDTQVRPRIPQPEFETYIDVDLGVDVQDLAEEVVLIGQAGEVHGAGAVLV